MNIGGLTPPPNIATSRPIKISPKGNLYKIPITHTSSDGKTSSTYEVWTTKEAVQQHFMGLTEDPKKYDLEKFARQTYEKQLRSNNGSLPNKGILITTDSVTHGDPNLWPHILNHPEIKV